jgi:multimeric flavodoxin WrbA
MQVPIKQFIHRLLAWYLLFQNLKKVPLAKIVAARYRPAKETGHILLLI